MTIRSAVLTTAMAGACALTACGDDDKKPAADEAKTTPQQAIVEIGAVRQSLDTALGQLHTGDKAAAEETVSEAYVQHFEKVEGPLDQRDHELNEDLEETLSGELRDKIKSAPVPDVEKLVEEIKGDLDTAEAKLR
jgi:hypothetical protein